MAVYGTKKGALRLHRRERAGEPIEPDASGSFILGVSTARLLMNVGRAQPQDYDFVVGAPA
jgi:hypothetical protein